MYDFILCVGEGTGVSFNDGEIISVPNPIPLKLAYLTRCLMRILMHTIFKRLLTTCMKVDY